MPPAAACKVLVISLGCAKNLVDTEVMCASLGRLGFALTNELRWADVVLINTCSFIADARAEAEGEMRRALRWKKRKRGRRVLVAGCLPQRNVAAVAAAFPGVDLFLGLDDVPRVGRRLQELLAGEQPPAAPPAFAPATWLYDHTAPRLQLTPRHYAYLKIAEGCDNRCRFCIIPHVRGAQRSRTVASVVAEAQGLLAQGVRELNLIAQDTTAYGRDLGAGTTLATLLRELEALPSDFWLRVLYTNPARYTDDLIELFASGRHLLPYLDVPLQHINDDVLRQMGRRQSAKATRTLLARLRERVSGLTLRTTFLVGYPGETEVAYRELYEFVQEFRFERLGVFVFSPEEGTPAATITEGLVPCDVARERRDALMALQQGLSQARNAALVGQTLPVLLERPLGDGQYTGRTQSDAPEVDNLVLVQGPATLFERGIVPVQFTGAGPYDLAGVALA